MRLLHVLGKSALDLPKYSLLKTLPFVALGVHSVVLEVLKCYKVADLAATLLAYVVIEQLDGVLAKLRYVL
jgi:hypothetical protein